MAETLLVLKFLRELSSPLGHARPTLPPPPVEGGAGGGGGGGAGVETGGGFLLEVGFEAGGEVGAADDERDELLGRGLQRLVESRFFLARSW